MVDNFNKFFTHISFSMNHTTLLIINRSSGVFIALFGLAALQAFWLLIARNAMTFLYVANWKMNKNSAQTNTFVKELNNLALDSDITKVVLCPSFVT